MRTTFNKQRILLMCQIMGVGLTFSLPELKKARDLLYHHYHPDKHPNATETEKTALEEIFKRIQNSYDYLHENHQSIQEYFKEIGDFSLIGKGHRPSDACWTYATVSSYTVNSLQ